MCVYIHMYISVYVYIYMYVCMYVCIYVYTFLYIREIQSGNMSKHPRPGGEAAEAISHVLGADCEAQGTGLRIY